MDLYCFYIDLILFGAKFSLSTNETVDFKTRPAVEALLEPLQQTDLIQRGRASVQ